MPEGSKSSTPRNEAPRLSDKLEDVNTYTMMRERDRMPAHAEF